MVTNIEKKQDDNSYNLLGKTFQYDYGPLVYEVNFKSETELHWKQIKGEQQGKEADEKYSIHHVNPYTFFIAWIEEEGFGISQVLDVRDKVIETIVRIDKELMPLQGTIREL